MYSYRKLSVLLTGNILGTEGVRLTEYLAGFMSILISMSMSAMKVFWLKLKQYVCHILYHYTQPILDYIEKYAILIPAIPDEKTAAISHVLVLFPRRLTLA